MPQRPDFETYLLRRELVRVCYRQNLSVPDIIRRLDQNNLFFPHQTYNAKYSLVIRLLRSVKREDARRFTSYQTEANQALAEYIARQEFLYMKAVGESDYELAAKLSKDIARAHGVPTEEPVRVEVDILKQMEHAYALGEKKIRERRAALNGLTPALDVAPRLLGNGTDRE